MAKDHGPSIKDDERYEALREDGMSKEKAARIANTPADEAGRKGGEADPYEEWTVEELRETGLRRSESMAVQTWTRTSSSMLFAITESHAGD